MKTKHWVLIIVAVIIIVLLYKCVESEKLTGELNGRTIELVQTEATVEKLNSLIALLKKDVEKARFSYKNAKEDAQKLLKTIKQIEEILANGNLNDQEKVSQAFSLVKDAFDMRKKMIEEQISYNNLKDEGKLSDEDHKHEVQSLREYYENIIENLKATHKREKDSIIQKYKTEIRQIEESHTKYMRVLRDSFNRELSSAKEDILNLKKKLGVARNDLEQAKSSLSSNETLINNLTGEIRLLTGSLMDQESKDIRIVRLKKELEEAKLEQQRLQEELTNANNTIANISERVPVVLAFNAYEDRKGKKLALGVNPPKKSLNEILINISLDFEKLKEKCKPDGYSTRVALKLSEAESDGNIVIDCQNYTVNTEQAVFSTTLKIDRQNSLKSNTRYKFTISCGCNGEILKEYKFVTQK
jgi:chromosome segregation ATPase